MPRHFDESLRSVQKELQRNLEEPETGTSSEVREWENERMRKWERERKKERIKSKDNFYGLYQIISDAIYYISKCVQIKSSMIFSPVTCPAFHSLIPIGGTVTCSFQLPSFNDLFDYESTIGWRDRWKSFSGIHRDSLQLWTSSIENETPMLFKMFTDSLPMVRDSWRPGPQFNPLARFFSFISFRNHNGISTNLHQLNW